MKILTIITHIRLYSFFHYEQCIKSAVISKSQANYSVYEHLMLYWENLHRCNLLRIRSHLNLESPPSIFVTVFGQRRFFFTIVRAVTDYRRSEDENNLCQHLVALWYITCDAMTTHSAQAIDENKKIIYKMARISIRKT